MRKLGLFAAVSAIGILSAGAAFADDKGWYLRGNAGYGLHHDADLTGDLTSNVHGNGLQSEGNAAFTLGLGYEFDNNWRLELDGDTLDTSFGSISQIPSSKASLKTDSLMLNAIYEFDDKLMGFTPYLGAGLGLVKGRVNASAHDFTNGGLLAVNPACAATSLAGVQRSCDISDSDSGLGWQLLGGLERDITENLKWDTHYTYLNGPDLDLAGVVSSSLTNNSAAIASNFDNAGAHTVMTGIRYLFGHSHTASVPAPAPAPVANFTCWDGSVVFNAAQCAPKPAPVVQTTTCWDGSIVNVGTACPARPAPVVTQTYTCWDGSVVSDLAICPAQPVPVVEVRPNLNICGPSPVAIFNVPVNSTPKQMARLGTMPEFGDSHGLTPTQFYEKLDNRYKTKAVDKAYLDYLFKSMGYTNGWADAQPYMFSEEVLPVGTRGMLGLGEQHHYSYSILPTNERDRQAFRIQSANGSVVHFMKTCGNYMYACE